MMGSAVVYSGFILTIAGLLLAIKPVARLRVPTRRRGLGIAAAGLMTLALGLALPARDARVDHAVTRLDAFRPVWQFREVHSRRVSAPPQQVFDAIKDVRADEILLFQTLTWIRRGGRPVPASILNPGTDDPILDIAVRGGFVRLAEDAPKELVIGTVVARPPGPGAPLLPEFFQRTPPPGFAVAVMNFLVTPDRRGGSLVSTETRVFASGPSVRRRFAVYWRIIYPGSAIIRRMWLRAIDRRAARNR